MNAPRARPATLRDRLKNETRQIILDAFAACLADSEIDRVTFAEIAARAGVGERTVYRHFQTRDALLRALYGALSAGAGEAVATMETEADLTRHLKAHFAKFDAQASVIKSAVITPQGHELRMANRRDRNAGFLKALGDATAGFDERERRMIAGAVQHMHSASAWLALREGWGLSGDEAAEACAFAIRAMVRDARRRRTKTLSEG